ncbi:MAG: ATP-binding protein [Anaerolineales bacterium]|nr:ATP-binding protein [Anaerolineales bacterium]
MNYKPWFAVAEFVDNAIQSFIDYRDEIEKLEGTGRKLKVEIEWDATDGGRLIVRDNAAGIHQADYSRAFRPAAIPVDRSGLCEFGMGMKSAACWFSLTGRYEHQRSVNQ